MRNTVNSIKKRHSIRCVPIRKHEENKIAERLRVQESLFRMIVSIFVMLIAGLIGFFVGIRIDEAMGGAVLFSVIAGIACVIYTIENQEK